MTLYLLVPLRYFPYFHTIVFHYNLDCPHMPYVNCIISVAPIPLPLTTVQILFSEKLFLICIAFRVLFNSSHCTKNPIYVCPEIKLRGLVPNSYIHVSVSDLYIHRIGLPIWLQHEYAYWETENYNSVLEITRPPQFHFWEYINCILTGPPYAVQRKFY